MGHNILTQDETGSTIYEVMQKHAAQRPGAPAIRSSAGAELNYQALLAYFDRLRGALNRNGIGRGDRVALMIGDRYESIATYLAVTASATAVPLNPGATISEVAPLAERLGVKVIVMSADIFETHAPALATEVDCLCMADLDGPVLKEPVSRRPLGKPCDTALPSPADTAAILLSSGTESLPKAVPMSHQKFLLRAAADAAYLELENDDVCLNFRPPYFTGALEAGLLPTLLTGGTIVIPRDFDAEEFYDLLGAFGVSWYTGGPAYHAALLEAAPFHREQIESSRLRLIRSAGYRLSPEMHAELEDTFSVVCIEKYGSSETGPVCCNPLPPGRRKPGTVGPPDHCEMTLLNDKLEPVSEGDEGQIAVRGGFIFDGYFNDAERTEAAFRDGWYLTGDLGRFDPDGYLTITGRMTEIINQGGQKISPVEVELALETCEGISDSICFGVPHPTLGQMAVAAIVVSQDYPPDMVDLRTELLTRLSSYKIPARIVSWDEIPRGQTGKPLRGKASERYRDSPSTSLPQIQRDLRSPLIRTLCRLWCDVLFLKDIREDEEFFALGGDSLRSVRLLAEVESVCAVKLPDDCLFGRAATVSGMAGLIKEIRRAKPPVPKPVKSASLGKAVKKIFRGRRTAMPIQAKARKKPQPQNIAFVDTEAITVDEIVRRLRLTTDRWEGRDVGGDIPVYAYDAQPEAPVLFWCFNARNEPAAMAKEFGGEVALHALRSMNKLVESKDLQLANLEALSQRYRDEILRIVPSGPILLGGNCQSGQIAESIARLLIREGRKVAQLTLLEYEPREPYPGRVSMFFGAESFRLNPFHSRPKPEADWLAMHDEVVWDLIPGRHGQYFQKKNLVPFTARLKERFREALDRQDSVLTASDT